MIEMRQMTITTGVKTMNKKTIIIGVAIAVIVIVVLIFVFSGKKESPEGEGGINVLPMPVPGTDTPDTIVNQDIDPNAATISTSDDVFNQLDDAVDYAG